MMNCNTSTASRAPMGSMTIPSQRRMLATCVVGRTLRSIGTITVGPVTTVSAPNRIASSREKFSNQYVASVVTSQVINRPLLTKRRTTCSRPLISLKRKVRLPSNSTTATASEINGNNSSPNKLSGLSQPNTGPIVIPAINKNRIAGSFIHQASH